MSAETNAALPQRSMDLLAPKFRAAVEAALQVCNEQHRLDAYVFETYRSNELQKIYYARGRTVKPPHHTVTNAPDNLRSWHGYGLAVDVIHRTQLWSPPGGADWFRQVAEIFKEKRDARGIQLIKWGGDWTRPDLPHFQWGRCKASPSQDAQDLIKAEGMQAVWEKVAAD